MMLFTMLAQNCVSQAKISTRLHRPVLLRLLAVQLSFPTTEANVTREPKSKPNP